MKKYGKGDIIPADSGQKKAKKKWTEEDETELRKENKDAGGNED